MTTATGTAQDSTLYGPDGRPLHHPATTPAGRTPSPAPSAGEWQPVAVQGTATVWEKNAAPAPAETARALEAELAGRDARIRELEQRLTIEAAKDHTPPPAPAPATPKKPWFDRHGPKIAMYAAVGLSASGEYALACLAGFYTPVAALLPIAMDVYVIQAMRRRRDVAAALILAVAANALDRLAEARLFGVDRNGAATWWLIVAVVAIAPFIVWRIHRITETKTSRRKSEPAAAEPAEPEPVREPQPEPTTVPEPQLVHEPAPQPVHEPAPEPSVEPVREPARTREPKTPRTTHQKPEPRTTSTKTNQPANREPANLGDRSAAKRTQMDLVLNLIDELGYDAVTLAVVRERTGMTKTTAYHRLTDARTEWNQRNAS